MARSETIWVVMDGPNNPVIVAAFTVKHELVTWLTNHPTAIPICRVFRCVDNPSDPNGAIREVAIGDLTYCRLCDLDYHVCPGCGTSVPHGTVACEACRAL